MNGSDSVVGAIINEDLTCPVCFDVFGVSSGTEAPQLGGTHQASGATETTTTESSSSGASSSTDSSSTSSVAIADYGRKRPFVALCGHSICDKCSELCGSVCPMCRATGVSWRPNYALISIGNKVSSLEVYRSTCRERSDLSHVLEAASGGNLLAFMNGFKGKPAEEVYSIYEEFVKKADRAYLVKSGWTLDQIDERERTIVALKVSRIFACVDSRLRKAKYSGKYLSNMRSGKPHSVGEMVNSHIWLPVDPSGKDVSNYDEFQRARQQRHGFLSNELDLAKGVVTGMSTEWVSWEKDHV
ncbi:hypothetical protein Pelo_2290 [Pelomyxa schiedti]|nr:hypothetical protein Pelo_2290 [Pelomyxa schiedti]